MDRMPKQEDQPASSSKAIPQKRFEYTTNRGVEFSGPIDEQLFLRRSDSKTPSESEVVNHCSSQSGLNESKEVAKGFSTKDSACSDIDKLNAVNFSMSRRRNSQGIDKSNLQRSAQKFQSKPGKIVANYLPNIHGAADKSSDSSSIFQ